MEKKLFELTDLVEKLNNRLKIAKERNSISAIETDILLDLLRQCYIIAEELKTPDKTPEYSKSLYIAPVIQVVQESIEIKQEETEEKAPEVNLQYNEPESVKHAPVNEVIVPEPEPEAPTMLPLEEIPAMSFPQVEVLLDNQPIPQPHKDDSATTNVYSAVGSTTPMPPQQHTANSLFSKKQDSPQPMKPGTQTGDLFGGQTIADRLKKETPSLIDKINEGREDQTLAHKMQLKPINDLKTAIGINEKFQFVNDLFEGRIDMYNEAINRLNGCSSAFSADSIIDEYRVAHGWKTNSEAYIKLKTFITRRYL